MPQAVGYPPARVTQLCKRKFTRGWAFGEGVSDAGWRRGGLSRTTQKVRNFYGFVLLLAPIVYQLRVPNSRPLTTAETLGHATVTPERSVEAKPTPVGSLSHHQAISVTDDVLVFEQHSFAPCAPMPGFADFNAGSSGLPVVNNPYSGGTSLAQLSGNATPSRHLQWLSAGGRASGLIRICCGRASLQTGEKYLPT